MANKNHSRNVLKYGDIKWLSGGSTKVQVFGSFDSDKPLVKILEAGIRSRYKVGDEVHISRRCLYHTHGKNSNKYHPEMQPNPIKAFTPSPPLKQLEI